MMSDFDRLDSNTRLAIDDLAAQPSPGQARAGSPGYGDPLQGGMLEEPHLLDYVRVLYKRRWIAGTAFAVVVMLVTVYTFTATPVYESTTKLLIEAENPNVVSFKEVVDEQGAKLDYYQTQYNILQSRTLARRTI